MGMCQVEDPFGNLIGLRGRVLRQCGLNKKLKNLYGKIGQIDVISLISAEWLLKTMDNGGAAIAFRSLFISLILFFVSLIIFNYFDNGFEFSADQLRVNVKDKMAWFGAFYGSSYVALYTRFSSQWSYLANLYNLIKQTSCNKGLNEDVMAEWKAGFIEDAEYLHLANKANFASIIYEWCKDEEVKSKYIEYTPGGEKRFASLQNKINKRHKVISKKWE